MSIPAVPILLGFGIVFVGILMSVRVIRGLWINWFAGNSIFFVHPTPKVDHLAAFGAERTKRIVGSLDGFAAGWALHW